MRYEKLETLYTRHLTLRRVVLEDLPAYFRLFGSSAVAAYMLWEPHTELAQSAEAIRKVLSRYETGSCYRWAITETGIGELIGIVELLRFDEETDSCSFAYMLREDRWGRGYGTEALEAALRFAFEKMEIRLITADHFASNPASGAVMCKVGMSYVRKIPGKYEKLGRLHDAVEYRITAEQWSKKTRC